MQHATLHTWKHAFESYLMMRSGYIRAIKKLLGHKSIRTTEIYAHLSDKHLYHVVSMLPSPNLGIVLGTPLIFLLGEWMYMVEQFQNRLLDSKLVILTTPTAPSELERGKGRHFGQRKWWAILDLNQ